MGLRVFISADIEGTAGVVSLLQCVPGEAEYEMGKRLMTGEVTAAVQGAVDAGASEVVVCDSHANMQNILPEQLHPQAELVRGAIRDSLQMQGIDETYDALFVTGAHAMAGTHRGVLDHSWVSRMVYNIRIDGVTLNEPCLNAVTAGYYGVPLVMVSGDRAMVEQTQAVLPDVRGAVVKEGYSRYCARSLHPEKARALMRQTAKEALGNLKQFKPVSVPNPLCMEIDFYRTDMADAAELVPGVKRLGSRTISFSGDPEQVFRVQELVLYRLKYEM